MSVQDRLRTLRSQLASAAEIFDETGYRRRYGLPNTVDALSHYLETGAASGMEPNPLFVGAYYSEAHTVPVSNARTPLEHFMAEGLAAGFSPHPLFDATYYAKECAKAGQSGLPLYLHFLRTGVHEDYSCTPLFSPRWYRQSYSYFQFEQLSPFIHYLTSGHRTDNNPNELFDLSWYKSMYGQPSVAGLDPLTEFVWFGQNANHMPNPLFDTWFYRDQYPDVAERGINALADYITDGWKNGRFPNPLFDGRYYVERYTDIAESGVNPLGHYLHHGGRERRDPSGLFSTRFYLSQIPNGTRSVENPLQHFMWEGCVRGLNPHPAFDTAAYRKTHILNKHSNALVNLIYSNRDEVNHLQRPVRGDGDFVSRELGRNGVWHDGWCDREVILSFISSSTAMVSFSLWARIEGQSVRIEVDGKIMRQTELPFEQLVDIRVPVPTVRHKTVIRLFFAAARALTETDPRVAAALIKDIRINADASVKPTATSSHESHKVGQTAAGLEMFGDVMWSLRYARHRSIKSAVKRLVEMRSLRDAEFDQEYYLSQDPFVGTPRMDPLRHYVLFGAERQLDPSRSFSTRFYLEANDDVCKADVNPFWHYLKYGRAENRRSEPSDPSKKKLMG